MKTILSFLVMLLTVNSVFGQETAGAVKQIPAGNIYEEILLGAVIVTAVLALIACLIVLQSVKTISKKLLGPTTAIEQTQPAPVKEKKVSVWNRILELKPIAEEKDLMLEHEFDGITELDNPTPGWFMWLFYGTIAFAIVYLGYYHVFHLGKLQDEEYAVEMKMAATEKTAYLAKSANNIDENSVKLSSDASVLGSGAAIFKANCVACHGDKAQGVVGPNLTDEFWLHGGKVNNVFKTIKYGVPEKGMISWEKTLSPKQISDVANYILSLKGSNPANPKAPQGNKES